MHSFAFVFLFDYKCLQCSEFSLRIKISWLNLIWSTKNAWVDEVKAAWIPLLLTFPLVNLTVLYACDTHPHMTVTVYHQYPPTQSQYTLSTHPPSHSIPSVPTHPVTVYPQYPPTQSQYTLNTHLVTVYPQCSPTYSIPSVPSHQVT